MKRCMVLLIHFIISLIKQQALQPPGVSSTLWSPPLTIVFVFQLGRSASRPSQRLLRVFADERQRWRQRQRFPRLPSLFQLSSPRPSTPALRQRTPEAAPGVPRNHQSTTTAPAPPGSPARGLRTASRPPPGTLPSAPATDARKQRAANTGRVQPL